MYLKLSQVWIAQVKHITPTQMILKKKRPNKGVLSMVLDNGVVWLSHIVSLAIEPSFPNDDYTKGPIIGQGSS